MDAPFVPVTRMVERAGLARDDSDTSYFFDLLYFGEFTVKLLVLETLAGMQDDRDNYRYSLERRLLQADGIGVWADVLDEALTGPPSQHLVAEVRDSQRALTMNQNPDADSWQRQALNRLNDACRCLDSTREDLSHQRVSLRQWVRAFIWLRNRTRGHGATKATTLSTICRALQASIDAVVKNAPAFQRSWAHVHRKFSGKYRISSFGGDREPFAYLTQEPHHSLKDGCYVFLDGPRRAPLLFTDPDLSDFLLPNGNFRNGAFQALSYITDEVRTENGSAWALPAQARPASETAATPDLDVVGRVFTNMPPPPQGYIKRTALESGLATFLRDDRHPIITLQGRGGVGKTSLALEVLHELAQDGDLFAIVWFSARDIDLLPQGPRLVRPDVLSSDDVARDFMKLMRPESPFKPQEAKKYLTGYLSGQAEGEAFLFVFDNFETILDPAELYAYLDNAVRLPNKILITTRTRDFKADYPIEVRGMNRDEFAKLVSETAARLGIEQLIRGTYEDQLFEESDGHPYITKVLLGEMARKRQHVSPQRAVAANEAMLEALFNRSFSALSSAAQRVFLTLCSWRSLVPRIGLEAVLLRPANERLNVEHAIAELEQTSLVETLGQFGNSGAFLSVPLAASLFGKRKLVTSPLKIAIEADLELIHGFGAATTTEATRGVGPRVKRMAHAAARRAEEGKEISQELAVMEYIATEYTEAWLTLAELQENQLGEVREAIYSVSRYLESRPNDEEAWKHLIRLYKSAEDPVAEMNARLQLAELGRPAFSELSWAANRLNGLLSRNQIALGADEKRLMVRKLRSLMEARKDEAEATDLSRLAWLCLRDQDPEAAQYWITLGLTLDPQNHYCLSLKHRLAREDEIV